MKKGALLAEALISVLILSVTIVALLGSYASSTRLVQKTKFVQKLQILFLLKMNEYFKIENIKDGEEFYGNFPPPYNDCKFYAIVEKEEINYEKQDFPIDLPDLQPRYWIKLKIEVPMNNKTYIYNTKILYSNIDFLSKPKKISRFRLDEEAK